MDGGLESIEGHDSEKRHRTPGGAVHSTDLWPVSSAKSKPFEYFNYTWFLRHTEEPLETVKKRDRQQQYGGDGEGEGESC